VDAALSSKKLTVASRVGYNITTKRLSVSGVDPPSDLGLRGSISKSQTFYHRIWLMTITVEAIYENGVLKPAQPLPLHEHDKVDVVIYLPAAAAPPSVTERQAALQRLLSQELPVADWEQMEEEILRGATE